MTASVHRIEKEKDAPEVTSPAIGISVTHTTAENRNIVMQCFVPFDCDQSTLDSALDKLFIASSRQESKAKLPVLRRSLELIEKTYARNAEDLTRIDQQISNIKEGVTADGRRNPTRSKPDEQRLARLENDWRDRVAKLESGKHERDVALDTIAQLEREINREA